MKKLFSLIKPRHCKEAVRPRQSILGEHRGKRGFSLIELIVSLMVVSVITTAFAPIITSKLKHREISFANKKIKIDCTKYGDECLACDDTRCTICRTSFGVPDGKFVNPEDGCHLQNCSTKFGGACTRCIKEYCQSCQSGYGFDAANKTNLNACGICSPGYVSTGGANACSPCPAGTAQSASGKSSCNPCASDSYSNAGASSCTKCSNSFGGCSNCNASGCSTCWGGYYKSGTTCYQRKCPAGQRVVYSPNNAYCAACTGNTKQPNNNYTGTDCTACGANEAANAAHTSCNSTCVSASSCGSNQALVDGCNCSTCGSGTVPNAAKTACVTPTCAADEYLVGSTCTKCSNTFTNCKKCNSSACTECNSGYKYRDGVCKQVKTPSGQSDCAKFDAIYIPNSVTNGTISSAGVCMTKVNAGDPGGPTVAYSSITQLVAGTTKSLPSCGSSQACCWSGALTTRTAHPTVQTKDANGVVTATTYYCTGAGSVANAKVGSLYSKANYPSCSRTVCNYDAATIACSNYSKGTTIAGDWSLPDNATVDRLKNYVNVLEPCPDPDATAIDGDGDRVNKYSCNGPKFKASTAVSYVQSFKGSDGLQLCDNSTSGGTGGLRCWIYQGACKGSDYSVSGKTWSDICVPGAVWMAGGSAFVKSRSFIRSGTTSFGHQETNTTVNSASFGKKSAFSVRCILKSYVE